MTRSKGYDVLHKSIRDHGQMEPVYVWQADPQAKYLVLEGATRVTILRDLARRTTETPDPDRYRYVRAKVLPPDFSEADRVILLARIHVRGSGVRSWGRYVEAKFIHDCVSPNGRGPLMTATELADHMAKSLSWVTRLKEAYTFAEKFVEHLDSEDAESLAWKHFSTLEEISKSTGFGKIVRDYDNPDFDELRSDVFDMVKNEVFKEYRDARFMKQFHDDPEKWEQLRTHELHIANKLAAEERKGAGNLATKLRALPTQVERALDRDPEALDAAAVEYLDRTARMIEGVVAGAPLFRIRLRAFTQALSEAKLREIKDLQEDDYRELVEALEDLEHRVRKHTPWGQSL